ncbi:hypothetical protein DFR29_107211 [Tahibacter aquaticus]|uniref:Uncharacterized protein n=1 Tax=Tahibacter aquaticus TaxID=520092 RepID=A0A4V3DM82_9GAMM|nr:hypothetical protein DFR29_107211 [Tahibacter aquaticus]
MRERATVALLRGNETTRYGGVRKTRSHECLATREWLEPRRCRMRMVIPAPSSGSIGPQPVLPLPRPLIDQARSRLETYVIAR